MDADDTYYMDKTTTNMVKGEYFYYLTQTPLEKIEDTTEIGTLHESKL